MKLSTYHLATDVLNDFGLAGQRIIFSTRTATSILLEEDTYQQMLTGVFTGIDNDKLETLIESQFIVPADEDEFMHIMQMNGAAKSETDFLSLTIQPTANCQLGCHYCGQLHTNHQANDEMIDKYYERVKEMLGKKPYKGVSITWYGGEPLTGYRSLKKTSMKLIALCTERGIPYISNMVTNGLSLKPALFEELVKECRVTSYQITLDGTAESHDQRRVTKKTREATFDIITRNIMAITQLPTYREHKCDINIRVNIDKTNYQYVDPLIDFINDHQLNKKVNIYFARVSDFGGNDAGKAGLPLKEFAGYEIEWLFKCYENGMRISVLPQRKHSVCMAEHEDSEVFDAYGNIYACWEFPYSETYGSGEHLIGNLNNPSDTYNTNSSLRNWSEVVASGETWCKTCSHLPVCGGGCPKSWMEKTPACPPFKMNYKEKLLLDYYIRKNRETEPVQEEAVAV